MKGIAITLASREDAEAIERIEKLLGHKIPRAGADEPAPEKEEAAPAKLERPRRAERKERPEPKREPAPDRSPVIEDMKNDWNGPLPGFLSQSAG